MIIKIQLQTTLLAALLGISGCKTTTASNEPTTITANPIHTDSVKQNSDSTSLAGEPKSDMDIYETN